MSDVIPLAGAVDGLRMLKDGGVSVTLIFEPKDRVAVMTMMGQPGASIACVRLKDGHAAVPAPVAQRDTRGPLCKEACDLCRNPAFLEFIASQGWSRNEYAAKSFILAESGADSRKDLDTIDSARNLFISNVRKPFQQWLRKQEQS